MLQDIWHLAHAGSLRSRVKISEKRISLGGRAAPHGDLPDKYQVPGIGLRLVVGLLLGSSMCIGFCIRYGPQANLLGGDSVKYTCVMITRPLAGCYPFPKLSTGLPSRGTSA